MSSKALLMLQARVLGALVLRETRATFGTTNLGYLWAILVPAAGTGLLMWIFTAVGRQPPFGESLALFFATGLLVLQLFNDLSSKLMSVYEANKALLTYPIIKDLDTLFARSLLIMLTHILIMTLLLGALVLLELAHMPAHWDQLILAFLAIMLIGMGFGALNAVLISFWASWRQIEAIITRPLFFISGVFYVPSALPPEAIAILQWNPILHLIEWFREGYYINYYSLVLDKSYPLYMGLVLLVLGFAGERVYRYKRY